MILGTEYAAAQALGELRKRTATEASPLHGIGYVDQTQPVDSPGLNQESVDLKLRRLVSTWTGQTSDAAAAFRSSLGMDDFYTLIDFATRSVAFSLRSGDPSWVRAGLAGLVLVECGRVDQRDLRRAIGVTVTALRELDPDARQALETARSIAEPWTSDLLAHLMTRTQSRLSDWSYEPIGDADSVILASCWTVVRPPSRILAAASIEIATAISSDDRYWTARLKTGGAVPAIWLDGGPKENKARRLMQKSTEVIEVSAEVDGAHWTDHHFLIWVAEVGSSRAAKTIAICAHGSTRDHARFATSSGMIVVIGVAKSTVVGQPSIETNKTMQRFVNVVQDAIGHR